MAANLTECRKEKLENIIAPAHNSKWHLMQAVPNYQPYAIKVAQIMGGNAVFIANIGQALSASPFANVVLACDIDLETVQFYQKVLEAMVATPVRADFLPQFNAMLNEHKGRERAVAVGALENIPFLANDWFYTAVRENYQRVAISNEDALSLLGRLRRNRLKARVIDFNNVMEYLPDWNEALSDLPLERGGVVFIGKRDETVYKMPNGRLNPGILTKGLEGRDAVAPSGATAISVRQAVKQFGLVLVNAPLLLFGLTGDGNAFEYGLKESGGVTKILVSESVFDLNRASSKKALGPSFNCNGGTHSIFTLQYTPKSTA